MSVRRKVADGVRYMTWTTYDSRWGPGRVHLQYWDRVNRRWVIKCGRSSHGYDSDWDKPVTCQECQES